MTDPINIGRQIRTVGVDRSPTDAAVRRHVERSLVDARADGHSGSQGRRPGSLVRLLVSAIVGLALIAAALVVTRELVRPFVGGVAGEVSSSWRAVGLGAVTLPGQVRPIEAVAWTGSTFVALESGDGGVTLWQSSDGERWQSMGRAPHGDRPMALAGRGTTVVAVGRAQSPDGSDRPAFWRVDETGWRAGLEIDDAGTAPATDITAVARVGSGFVAAGLAPVGTVTADLALWTSADGLRWQRVADPLFEGIGFVRIAVTGRDDGSILVVAGRQLLVGRAAGGWSVASVPTPGDPGGLGAVASSSTRVLVAGCSGSGAPPAVWVLTPGLPPYQSTLASDAGCVRSLTFTEGMFHAAGDVDGHGAVWSSRDGLDWMRVGGSIGDTTAITGVAVASDGTVLAIGWSGQDLPLMPRGTRLFVASATAP